MVGEVGVIYFFLLLTGLSTTLNLYRKAAWCTISIHVIRWFLLWTYSLLTVTPSIISNPYISFMPFICLLYHFMGVGNWYICLFANIFIRPTTFNIYIKSFQCMSQFMSTKTNLYRCISQRFIYIIRNSINMLMETECVLLGGDITGVVKVL